MRICVYACMYAHLANISKIVQDATRAGTQQAPEPEHHRSTSDHHKSTRAGAQQAHQRTRIAKEITKTIVN